MHFPTLLLASVAVISLGTGDHLARPSGPARPFAPGHAMVHFVNNLDTTVNVTLMVNGRDLFNNVPPHSVTGYSETRDTASVFSLRYANSDKVLVHMNEKLVAGTQYTVTARSDADRKPVLEVSRVDPGAMKTARPAGTGGR